MNSITSRAKALTLGMAAVAAVASATPSAASEVGKNTFLGGAAGAAAGGLLSHGSPVGIVAGAAGGAVLGHVLSPRDRRYRSYGYRHAPRGRAYGYYRHHRYDRYR